MASARQVAVIAGALALGVLSAMPAQAAVISTFTNRALTAAPFTATFGGGVASLSFTAATTGYGPGAAVATGGNAQVTTIFGQVADYQLGTTFDGTASYAAFASPAVVQYSAADDILGFTYIGTDGTHYGYAEVFGSNLIGYAYESTAGASITANNVVPEPASIALLLGGVGAIGLVRRRKGTTAHA